jgi:hypothetical protein
MRAGGEAVVLLAIAAMSRSQIESAARVEPGSFSAPVMVQPLPLLAVDFMAQAVAPMSAATPKPTKRLVRPMLFISGVLRLAQHEQALAAMCENLCKAESRRHRL